MKRKKMTDDVRGEKARAPSGGNRLFYRNLASDRPQLFGAIMRFNASINRKAGLPEPENEVRFPEGILAESNRAKARLHAGDTVGFWDFEEESRRIALLNADVFNELILSWGSAFCAPMLNRFILKKDVEILNRDIGGKYLDFARGKGRFTIGDIGEIIRVEEEAAPSEDMRSLVLKYGMRAHGICSTAWPEALQAIETRRIERHLPDLFEERSPLTPVDPSHLRAIWFSMKKILLKEVAPLWTPCFS